MSGFAIYNGVESMMCTGDGVMTSGDVMVQFDCKTWSLTWGILHVQRYGGLADY